MLLSLSEVDAQSMRLKEIKGDNDMNKAFFHYNDDNLVDSIYQQEFNPNGCTDYTYRLIKYDGHKNISQEQKYLSFTNEDFYLSDEVAYTYDEKNRLVELHLIHNEPKDDSSYEDETVKNTITYTYDDSDRLISEYRQSESVYFYDSEYLTYTYDNDGRLVTVDSEKTKKDYSYDNDGHVTTVMEYVKTNGKTTASMSTDYKYDDKDNMTERIITDRKENQTMQKYVVKHDTSLLSDYIQYPTSILPVDNLYSLADSELYTLSKNAVSTVDVYTMHWWEGRLGKDHTATFVYEEHIGSGIEQVQGVADIVTIAVNDGIVTIDGATAPMHLFIYDATGSIVSTEICNETVDINHLPSGTYILKVGGTIKKIVR